MWGLDWWIGDDAGEHLDPDIYTGSHYVISDIVEEITGESFHKPKPRIFFY
jgi:hypothetical protein